MVSVVNSKADVLRAMAALNANANAAKGLAEVLKSNLGPRGALKMLVGGAGQIKITKDGAVLLQEMQIQHPTAAMIARAARAQDEETGDGTTSNVLFVAELMKLSERQIADGLHPRLIADGFNLARMEAMTFLESFKKPIDSTVDKMKLIDVARTSLRTKLPRQHADQLASIVVEAVDCIRTTSDSAQVPLDLFMIEIMEMKERLTTESRLVRGLVLDHGTRDAEMPKRLEKCFILTLNVSLEFENTEVNSTFFYSSAEEREKLVASERKFTDDKVRKIVELKNKVCSGDKSNYGFFLVNQKGIDPPSLDMLAKEGIMAVRRAKRRNMERITLACGGNALNSVDDLCPSDLGFAELVYEKTLGDDKYTFIEGVSNPQSCTILIKGPNDHEINQLKDAVRDGLRAVRNTLIDKCLVPGAGSFELACRNQLLKYAKTVSGKTRLGVEIFADALMVAPRTLAENSGFDVQETILKLEEEFEASGGKEPIGLDLYSGEAISPEMEGIYDNYAVKRQMLMLAPVLAEQMLLVDEVIRAGKQMGGQ